MRETFAADMLGASPEAIQAHYDTGDAFFALFLDPTLSYSCALFEEAVDLEAAQRAKIDWHLKQAGAGPHKHLLDIGCGWGALLRRAVDLGVSEAVGLTLSHAQANSPLPSGARAMLLDWRDHVPPRPYDCVVSIGAFEHFASPFATHRDRVAGYRAFFRHCSTISAPNARLSLQTIAYPESFDREAYDASDFGDFVRRRIFPQSDLPTLNEILEAAEGTFELACLRNDRLHYARTTRAWLSRLRSNRASAEALVGGARVAEFERYFRLSIGAFEIGNLLLLRLAFGKAPISQRRTMAGAHA